MSPTFTDDDIGKSVESASGETLGVVTTIDEETAYVEPDPEFADSMRAVLEWKRDSEPAVPLGDDAVDEITAETIRLEAEFPDESITTGTTDEGDSPDDRPRDGRAGDVEYAHGEPVASNVTETETDVDGSDRGVGTGDLDDQEPMVADEFYDTREGGPRVDPDEEMDEAESGGPEWEGERNQERREEEIDAVEADASREVEVDPSELTDREPEAELEPGEDVGQRTDVGRDPDESGTDGADATADGPTTEEGIPDEAEIDSETDRPTTGDENESHDEPEDD